MRILFLIPICLVGAMLQAVFIVTEKMEMYKKAVVLKGFASLFFVAIGVFAALTKPSLFTLLIALGLGFGLIGDVCLNLRLVLKNGKAVFLSGIAAFLIGHILYLVAMALSIKNLIVLLISAVAGVALASGLLVWIFKNITAQKVFKIFGIFYVGAVVLMTAVAAGTVLTHFSISSLVFLIGAVLFTASDVILIFNMFSEKKKAWMRPTNLSLYYLGQLLIAMSLFL